MALLFRLTRVQRPYQPCQYNKALFSTQSSSPSTRSDSFVGGIYSLLNDTERRLLNQQRALVGTARRIAKRVGLSLPHESNNILNDSVFSVVVAGEFNSGKSTVINALLGQSLVETGTLPTTDCITILSSSKPADSATTNTTNTPGVLHYAVNDNIPLLRDLQLVDTPGTNALDNHTARTLQLLPKADAILFVTSADQPLKQSERHVLESIQQYRKSIVLIINKMDILESAGGDHGHFEKKKLLQYVSNHASDLLGANPTVIPVSARNALTAKQQRSLRLDGSGSDDVLWQRSNFAALETYLRDTLTRQTRVQAKLLNPVGLAEGWMTECLERLASESRALEADRATLNLLASQREAWTKDAKADMDRAIGDIGQRLDHEGKRAHILVQRLAPPAEFYRATLLDSSRLAREWNKTQSIVYKHDILESELKQWIAETADAIALKGRAQGQTVIEFLGQRPSSRNKSLVGSVMTASKFEDTRDNLRRTMDLALRRYVLDEDLDVEQRQFLEGLQSLARGSSMAFSLGIASLAATAMQLVDLASGAGVGALMAMSGAFVLSNGRSKFVQAYRSKWKERNQTFHGALQIILKEELDRVEQHIQNGVTPYSRFVEADDERIAGLTAECQDLLVEAHVLRKAINQLDSD